MLKVFLLEHQLSDEPPIDEQGNQCAFNRELILSEDNAEDNRFHSCCAVPISVVGTLRRLYVTEELHREHRRTQIVQLPPVHTI